MVLVRARPPVFMRRICIKTDLGWALSRYLSESEQLIGLFGSLATHFTSRLKSSKKRHRLRRCCLFEFSLLFSPLPDSPCLSSLSLDFCCYFYLSVLSTCLLVPVSFTLLYLLFSAFFLSSFHFYRLVPLSTYEILLYVCTGRRFYCHFSFFPHFSFSSNRGLSL